MIKILKVSIENFKGIKSLNVFDFDDFDFNVNVLSGPNGFGKTTIFEVIELCLAGEFNRVELFDTVQKKNKDRNKPFFQNTDGIDVVLKLLLINTETGKHSVIIKHYDDVNSDSDNNSARKNIPAYSNKLFKTYLTDDISYFTLNKFDTVPTVEQAEISNLIYGNNSNIEIASTYYLFNYIQQENSIYFLRKSEDDKGASLGFLFNIEKEEKDKIKLVELKTNLLGQSSLIQTKIDELKGALPPSAQIEFKKIFDDSDFAFDKEKPFLSLDSAKAELFNFEETLTTLKEFRQSFDVNEYNKSLLFKELNENIINNESLLKSFVFKKIYHPNLTNELVDKNIKLNKAIEFNSQINTSFINQEYFNFFLNDETEYNRYIEVENKVKAIDKDLGEIGVIISELILEREKALEAFINIKQIPDLPENNCPLCDTQFESYDKLEKAINFKTELLEKFNASKLKEKQECLEQIKAFRDKILIFTNKYIEENEIIAPEILSVVNEYSNYENLINQITETYSVLKTEEVSYLILSKIPVNKVEIEERVLNLKTFLILQLLKDFEYDEGKIKSKELYIQYFNSNRELFDKVFTEDFSTKIDFLRGQFALLSNDKLQFLESRQEKLLKIIARIDSIYKKVHSTIQDHKKEMINKIKIPFYVYSGKILQSYQQGLGIFVKIHPTGQNNNVIFKTGHKSDHDIVYHLSSGQMAVVSLAFCLSLNKVYNTNQKFKFLAIDDPIQTMDDLNIHTFIELIRNEFKDYQIITSTHDDFTSRYMQYKFDKYDMKTKIQNVQKLAMNQSLS